VWLVVGGVRPTMRIGILVGALSAFLVALFGAWNKRLVDRADPLTVTFLELAAGTCALFPPLLPFLRVPTEHDAILLLILAMGCTLLPFTLALAALRHASAYAAQLAVNLEPVYAVLLAWVLLGEQRELTGRFYGGVAIVVAVAFAYPLLRASAFPLGRGGEAQCDTPRHST
jgi:drug/metabolite transporter (DMT)-like permease